MGQGQAGWEQICNLQDNSGRTSCAVHVYSCNAAILCDRHCTVAWLQGKIRQDGSGLATFKATFQCITFRPFKGEVLDCIVSSVNKMGFFADAGPLQIFVSSHLIPEDYEYTSVNGDAFVSVDATTQIKESSEVRIRIVGVRTDPSDMFCIGTMKEDRLGVISSDF
eukprot:GHRR01015259.1.p1 GENE.GHRR01015259.1~~GHRR01015259.1.p1  ORF type:complete len:166 (+),score=41.22 GHRR01015259.1:1364-1861(+)